MLICSSIEENNFDICLYYHLSIIRFIIFSDAKLRLEGFDFWRNRGDWSSNFCIIKDLIAALLASSKWEKVHCVVRKRLEEWNNLPGK